MFIVGGEGYKVDLSKDNDYDMIAIETDNEDEDNKPVYPKNDVWIFESVLRSWTKLQFR